MLQFQGTVILEGKTATGIEVPAAVLEQLGGGKKPLITVSLNSVSYRTMVGSMRGKSMIPLSAENRALTGANAGDTLLVTLALDTEARHVEVPAALEAALAAHPAARTAFDALSNSAKKRHTLAVAGAKTDETRQRRVERAIADLSPEA